MLNQEILINPEFITPVNIPSFKAIGLLAPEKKIFKGFFTIYGRGGHLGHVTSTIGTNFG